MTSSRPSINTNDSAGQAPALDANSWLGVQRRHPPTAPTSSNAEDLAQFVQQLSPEEPWDGIAMFRAPSVQAEHWRGQQQYQTQYQPQDQLCYNGAQQQPQEDYSSQQHTSTRADQGSRPSERRREGSSRDKSRRDGKPKKGSKSNSSRK